MNETLKVLETRRSCRNFDNKGKLTCDKSSVFKGLQRI